MIIEGAISVKAALSGGVRRVERVYINAKKKTRDFNYIRSLCKNNNIPILEMDSEELSGILNTAGNGGIGAEVSLRTDSDFDDTDVFCLNGIEDPYNLGYCLRTLYALGIRNVLLDQRDYSNMEAQILRSSAGAYDFINIRRSSDLVADLQELKKQGYYLYGLYRGQEALDVFDIEFKPKAVFILGGEKRGIAAKVLELCDACLYISYGSSFRNALNAAAACDVLATLLYRQRRIK